MNLEQYLEQHGMARKLADKTGISAPEISRIRAGKKQVSFQNAALIEFGTDGAIKMESLIEDPHLRSVAAFIRGNHVPQQANS